ncbi:DUF3624 domain-containing protein [Photobacterium sanctipauli]|uniref:DUF3624 domain-containing protein n=1 Tax=Photobacterium sanctipauli TaxID=1342794 RepID=A0A2T3NSJ6_9GAMM|nr:DUF3624 domain-containing protein [Photobacterium sanctipauli]PSW19240.1 DUF3624 domain-containing protein [Photobacterium sanctipauli]
MAHCRHCTSSRIKQKLGRCRRCVLQLLLLAPLSWLVWWYFYLATPTSVESLTLLFAASGFTALLALHGIAALAIRHARKQKPDA